MHYIQKKINFLNNMMSFLIINNNAQLCWSIFEGKKLAIFCLKPKSKFYGTDTLIMILQRGY